VRQTPAIRRLAGDVSGQPETAGIEALGCFKLGTFFLCDNRLDVKHSFQDGVAVAKHIAGRRADLSVAVIAQRFADEVQKPSLLLQSRQQREGVTASRRRRLWPLRRRRRSGSGCPGATRQ
jgi:hypothetical protein